MKNGNCGSCPHLHRCRATNNDECIDTILGRKHYMSNREKQIRADAIDEIIEWLKTNPKYATCISSDCSEEVNSKIVEYYEHLVQQLKELKEQNND